MLIPKHEAHVLPPGCSIDLTQSRSPPGQGVSSRTSPAQGLEFERGLPPNLATSL